MTEPSALDGREQVVEAVDELLLELRTGQIDEWEYTTLASFLESFGALLGSIDNAYVNENKPVPADPWTIMAEVLRGARYYE